MKLQHITYGDNLVKGAILSDSGEEYTASYDGDSNITWCTCPWWVLNKKIETCKHILYLLDNIEFDKMKSKKVYKNFLSECMTIDTLMGNGFPTGSCTAVFGEPGVGKTLLSAQLALSCMKNLDKDVIVIETEGNREQDFVELLDKFRDRFGISKEDITKRLHFYSVVGEYQSQAIVTLLRMVGYDAILEKSKKGDKYTTTFKEIKPKLKEDILKKTGLIIVDSLTKPLKTSIGHKTQNLPARAELVAKFYDRMYQIARAHEIAVVVNFHASINKMQLFGRDLGIPYGGDEVRYNSKYIIEIVDSDMAARAKYGKSARRIVLYKHPYRPVDKILHAVNLKADYGFCDEE